MIPQAPSSDEARRRGPPPADRQGAAACAAAAAGFVVLLLAWRAGGVAVSVPWAPSAGLSLAFSLDGLGALYALLATGIGAVVFAYGARYLTLHLHREQRPFGERRRFWPWMVLFAVAMVGLATAQDLVLLFVFFELTALCSYFLIGFDRAEREARIAALTALLVTVASAVALLVAAVLFRTEYGTFSVPELVARAGPGSTTTLAGALIAVAALAKSAQVPLHFWLPRAMAAPTPVSAYLHSAAMVAAGVLVLGRVHPLLARSETLLTALLVAGLVSIAVGGALALGQDRMKQLLAYSTISQYGYVVMLYGVGGAAGSGAAAFYVLAHGVAKSALFMTAGAVTTATGEDRLSRLGGLARREPILAASAGVAAATLAALPLTVGFFKDELVFKAALGAGPLITVLAVLAAALTFAYIGRFWTRLFLGAPGPGREPEPGPEPGRYPAVPRPLVVPVVVLALVAVLGGVLVAPFERLAEDAATVTHAAPVSLSAAYHLDARPENLMALAAWTLGGLLIVAGRGATSVSRALAAAGERLGPQRIYTATLRGLSRLSEAIHVREVRDARSSVAAVLVPCAVLTALGFAVTPIAGSYVVGPVSGLDWLILPLLALVAVATLAVARARARLARVLALSVVGFALAGVYALAGAPDVALVAVVVDTMLTLMFLGALARVPLGPVPRERGPRRSHRWRDPLVGAGAGVAAFATIWGFLSEPRQLPGVAGEQIRLTPEAHGKDVVTTIVADFRGLDTLGEVTVLVVAVVGVAALLRAGRLW